MSEQQNEPVVERATAVPGRRPMYYSGGARHYGQVPYYGATPYYGPGPGYGAPYYYGGGMQENDSLTGTITFGRILRVCVQRWISILVFIILGGVGAFFVFKISPTIYEASSVLEMSIRPPRILATRGAMVEGDTTGTLEEVFNTRLARLRSRAMLEQVLARYHADHADSTVSEGELISTLSGARMTLQRRSRLVSLSVRSTSPQLAADLANAYALTAETFTQEENKLISEEAVAWLRTTVETQRRKLAQADQAILDFKVSTQVDALEKEKDGASVALERVNADIADLESRTTMAVEMLRTLQQIQNAPDRFGSLPENTPRADEIAQIYQKLQAQTAERNALLARYTDKHPDIQAKEKEVAVYQEQFADVVRRAYETAQANYDLLKSQMEPFRAKRTELSQVYTELQAKIDAATIRLHQLQRDLEVNERSYQALLNRMEEARLAHDENMCTIKVGETGAPPRNPISPKPMLIFPAGPAIGLILGLAFVLIVDHAEDKIIGISDIEQRLRMKVLCVLPHIQKKNREKLAVLSSEDKFSFFAEAFAGLRNILDSPRYADRSKVVLVASTQPREGKTTVSSNLALTLGASGQRTLLIDFDMRRPRQARIFGKGNDSFTSLPHTLDANNPELFASLPLPSGYPNLDLILSRASSEFSPATLVGTGVIVKFFEWARNHYDRVVIDSPPFGIVGDAVVLATMADSVVLLCCPERSHFGPLKNAIRQLTEIGARVLGVIANDVDFMRRSTFSGYDYHYRHAYYYGGKYGYSGKRSLTRRRTGKAAQDADAVLSPAPVQTVVSAAADE